MFMEPSRWITCISVPTNEPTKVPVIVPVTLNVIIKFSPAWRGAPAKLKQGKNSPLAGSGGPLASALGNVDNAPIITSAQTLVRRYDMKWLRFFINLLSFHCFGLPWSLVIENSFLAFHRGTARNPAGCDAESLDFLRFLQKGTKILAETVWVCYRRKRRKWRQVWFQQNTIFVLFVVFCLNCFLECIYFIRRQTSSARRSSAQQSKFTGRKARD